MCRPHWHRVPKLIRNAVWGGYAGGAGLGTLALLRAQQAAIRAVHDDLGEAQL